MKQTAIVYNPTSGRGRGAGIFETVGAMLSARGVPFRAYPSASDRMPAACTEQALADGAELVLVLGGDGTIHEAARPLVGTDAVLGIVPCGSGNDLSRSLGIPKDPGKAVEIALNGTVRRMDAGLANGELFFNVAGCGFDVDVLVNEKTLHSVSRNGSVPYYLALLKSLLHLNIRQTTAAWKGGSVTSSALIIAAGNGGFFGGGMNIAPGADPFDGMLDFCIIKDVHWYDVLFLLPRFLKGTHIRSDKVLYFRGEELTVTMDPASELELDGEIGGKTPVTFRVLPGALNIMVAAQPHTEG
ncbi:MAG: diacylglycerol kinase family lipid kinase [Clostridia bacterium]|nr:diacylglycerol kinase family lipid kinase [Clostridia bacterium]